MPPPPPLGGTLRGRGYVSSAGATLLGGAGPGSGAAEAAEPQGQEEECGPAGCQSSAPLPPAGVREQHWAKEPVPDRIGEARKTSARAARGPRSCADKSAGLQGLVAGARVSENLAVCGSPPRLPPPGTGSGCAARLGEGRSGHRGEPLAGRLWALCWERFRLLRRPAESWGCGPPVLAWGSGRSSSPRCLRLPPPLSLPPAVCGFQVDFLGGWLLLLLGLCERSMRTGDVRVRSVRGAVGWWLHNAAPRAARFKEK